MCNANNKTKDCLCHRLRSTFFRNVEIAIAIELARPWSVRLIVLVQVGSRMTVLHNISMHTRVRMYRRNRDDAPGINHRVILPFEN